MAKVLKSVLLGLSCGGLWYLGGEARVVAIFGTFIGIMILYVCDNY